MQKFLEITYLFDFYQALLTQKQRDLISDYYFEDLSLSELATTYQISRQSVFDTIKKAELKLIDYENKLQLWDKFKRQDELLTNLQNIISKKTSLSTEEIVTIKYVVEQLRSEI